MASESTNKTIWTVMLVAIVGVAAWFGIPALLKKLNAGGNGSSGSSGGATGTAGGYGYYPDETSQSQNPLASLLNSLLNSFSPNNAPGGHGSAPTGGAMPGSLGPGASASSVGNNDAAYAAAQSQADGNDAIESDFNSDQSAIDAATANQTIAPEQVENFDVNQMAYSPDAPDQVDSSSTSDDIGSDQSDDSDGGGDTYDDS